MDVDTMIPLEREILGCYLNYPRPQTFLSKGDREKQKAFLTFYETSLQICSQRSRGPQGWRSWTAAGLPVLGTTESPPEEKSTGHEDIHTSVSKHYSANSISSQATSIPPSFPLLSLPLSKITGYNFLAQS